MAGELGVKPEFSETQFDAIFAGLEAGRYDVIANQITVTDERTAKYDFSAPYTVSTGVVVTRSDEDKVHRLADVKGMTSAQSTTSSFAQTARDAGAKVEAVEGFAQAVTLLKQGRVDLTINDSLAVLEYLKTSGDTGVKIAAELPDRSEQAFVFRKDSGLAGAVNDALDRLRADGTLRQISEKYFGRDVSQ